MAKKKSHKKHSFKYAEPIAKFEASTSSVASKSTLAPSPRLASNPTRPDATVRAEYPFLRGDLTRLGVMAAALIAVEFGLWYLFGHSSLGQTVYNLYHVGQ